MKKVLVVIAMMLMMIMSATVNQPETEAAFPISSDARGNKVGVTLYAGVSTGGWVYVEPWMQQPWVTEDVFHENMVDRHAPAIVMVSVFYRFDDGTVECENVLLKPYVDDMLNDWIELWENELDTDFVEQVKAASRYWEAMWG